MSVQKLIKKSFGLWPIQTIWEYNPTMAGGYDAYVKNLMKMFRPAGDEPAHQTHNESFLRVRSDVQGREVWEGYGMTSIEHFVSNVDMLLEGGTLHDLGNYPDGNDGLQATKIATAVHESLETGNMVQI